MHRVVMSKHYDTYIGYLAVFGALVTILALVLGIGVLVLMAEWLIKAVM
jgi:hypothetical protein